MTVKYSKDHEWVAVENGIATIGITNHAQEQLGDVVFVELPAIGKQVTQNGDAAVVESVKAASEVFAPVSGTVTEAKAALADTPDLVNTAPEGDGWFFRLTLSNPAELEGLMDEGAYKAFVASL